MKRYHTYALVLLVIALFTGKVCAQNDSIQADSLISFSKQYLGTRYCYSNCTPSKGFDCSGFVYFVFNHFNINVPRSSKEYKNFGVKLPLDSAKKGDVIVFTGTNAKNRSPGHVGIVIDMKDGEPVFIHSSSGKKKGVIISDFNESPYYRKRFIKIVRIKEVIR